MNTPTTPLQAEIEIHRIAESYWSMCQDIWPALGAIPVITTSSRPSRVAGRAWNCGSKVEYNLSFVLAFGTERFTETVVHELAHIVQFRMYRDAAQAHGPEFRYVMQQLGFAGDTYHTMSSRVAKAVSSKMKEAPISIAGIL